jgi:hypothetical protein
MPSTNCMAMQKRFVVGSTNASKTPGIAGCASDRSLSNSAAMGGVLPTEQGTLSSEHFNATQTPSVSLMAR